MNCCVLGYGYWGKLVSHYIQENSKFNLIGVYDRSYEKSINLEQELQNQSLSAAFICLPSDLHYKYAKKLLDCGIHVFCEKPLCQSLTELLDLYETALLNNVTLMTDYIYTFSPGINTIKEKLKSIGEVKYIKLSISQFGKFYATDSVFDCVGIHLISALVHIFGNLTLPFKIIQQRIIKKDANDLILAAHISFQYGEMPGELYCSLIDGIKTREISIWGGQGSLHFNMLDEYTITQILYTRTHDKHRNACIQKFKFDEKNNLNYAINHFHELITHNSTDFLLSKRVMEIIDLLEISPRPIRSIENR